MMVFFSGMKPDKIKDFEETLEISKGKFRKQNPTNCPCW